MFDIKSARDLFAMLRFRFEEYSSEVEKSTEDAIAIVLIANHLREWIAPHYNPSPNNKWRDAKTDAERFSRRVFENDDFAIVRALANGTKHLKASSRTGTKYSRTVKDLHLGDVGGQPIMKGIPAAHFVNDRLLETVIGPVVKLYADWFEPKENSN